METVTQLASAPPLTLALLMGLLMAWSVIKLLEKKWPSISPTSKMAEYYSSTGKAIEELVEEIRREREARKRMEVKVDQLQPLTAMVEQDMQTGVPRYRRPTMDLTEEVKAVRLMLERMEERDKMRDDMLREAMRSGFKDVLREIARMDRSPSGVYAATP